MTPMSPPLHPMLVHFAVVFMLVTAVAGLLAVFSARIRGWLGWVFPTMAIVTAVTTKVTEHFGEELEHALPRSPLIHEHAEWGEKASWVAIAVALVAVLYWLATTAPQRWASRVAVLRRPAVTELLAVALGVGCIATIAFAYLAGHSGAVAVWSR